MERKSEKKDEKRNTKLGHDPSMQISQSTAKTQPYANLKLSHYNLFNQPEPPRERKKEGEGERERE